MAAFAWAQEQSGPPTLIPPEPPAAAAKAPSDAEQQDLMRAVNEAGGSAIDQIRVFETYLKKWPNTSQRPDIEKVLFKAAVDTKDNPRIIRYGEAILGRTADDVLALDQVSQALVALGGEDNAQAAIKHSRAFENIIDSMEPLTTGAAGAVARQEDRDRAMNRLLLTQARARIILGQNEEAGRLASRAFDVYPNEEAARVWANALALQNKEEEEITHLADAFAVPDPRAADNVRMADRLRLGEVYTRLHGSEKGLGDLILAAYDRTSGAVELRKKKVMSLDPNSSAADPTQFTITALDGKKLQIATLQGKVIIFDFWATWCVPCRAQYPLYDQVKEHYKGRNDVAFVSLDADEDRTLVEPFLTEQKWDKSVYFEDGLMRLLGVSDIPTTLVLDKHGKVSSRMTGFLPDSFVMQLIERVDDALAAK